MLENLRYDCALTRLSAVQRRTPWNLQTCLKYIKVLYENNFAAMIWQLRDLLSRNNWKIICAPKQLVGRSCALVSHAEVKQNFWPAFWHSSTTVTTHTIYNNNHVEVLGNSWFVNIYVELARPEPFHPSHPVFTWKGLHQIVGQHATIALTSHIHTWMIDAQDQAHGLFAKQAPRTIK